MNSKWSSVDLEMLFYYRRAENWWVLSEYSMQWARKWFEFEFDYLLFVTNFVWNLEYLTQFGSRTFLIYSRFVRIAIWNIYDWIAQQLKFNNNSNTNFEKIMEKWFSLNVYQWWISTYVRTQWIIIIIFFYRNVFSFFFFDIWIKSTKTNKR